VSPNTSVEYTGSVEDMATGVRAEGAGGVPRPESDPLDLSYERFSPEVNELRAQFSKGLQRSRSNPDPVPAETPFFDRSKTFVTVIQFPDGDVSVSGCHIGPPSAKSRPKASQEEKERKACSRARRTVKNTAKYFQIDHLWTLSYRGPHQDLVEVYQDYERFTGIVRKTFPDFAAIAVPELHLGGGPNHGGLHIHFGVRGFYDVGVLRSAWWEVVGEGQGNVDAQGPKGNISPRSIGNYLAKYISKSFENSPCSFGQHRYWKARSLEIKTESMSFFKGTFADHEKALRVWIIMATGKKEIFEWHSDDGGQFMFKTFL
jgi:hypothetical protein